MERSQSCFNFNYSKHANPLVCALSAYSSASSGNLRKLPDNKHELKIKQFLQQLEHGDSTDSVKSNAPQIPTAAPTTNVRRKRLQRQKSTTVYSGDEAEYAADLEEDGDDDIADKTFRTATRDQAALPLTAHLSAHKKKQVRFRSKQQSDSSLLVNNKSSNSAVMSPSEKTSSTSSLTSNCTSSSTHDRRLKSDGSFDSIQENNVPLRSKHMPGVLKRDASVQSDSSRYSSVDSLLESRKPDPEAILINLGFGPLGSEDILSRIPKRFLKPSQVKGIDTNAFIKRLQLANSIGDHSVLGYRGLTGNPDIPPSHIVAKIMQRFEVNERKKSLTSMELKLR
uniref:ITPR-interacting domain-containing protein n=1 Tax=Glossina morsitans morsitans TaxID=37546 RepID=A0A1B0FCY2_GLOMM